MPSIAIPDIHFVLISDKPNAVNENKPKTCLVMMPKAEFCQPHKRR